jgi:hypothetical protein
MPPGPARYDDHEESWLVALFGRVDAGNKQAGKTDSRKKPSRLKAVIVTAQHLVRKNDMSLSPGDLNLPWTSWVSDQRK